jgi:hypothetical protein
VSCGVCACCGQHEGRYKCVVRNAAGVVESPQLNLVLIPGIPTIEASSGDHEAVRGERVELRVIGAWDLPHMLHCRGT